MGRRLLLLVVAALLLRGWVGEAMAGQMLAQQLQLPSTHVAAMHAPDCPGAVAGDEDLDAAGQSLHCQDCTLHALTAGPLPLARLLPASRALAAAPAFASAERVPGDKPPIS
jgi:hypothetical protein